MSERGPGMTGDAVRRLVQSTQPYLSCEDCFSLVDRYVEHRLAAGPKAEDPTWSTFEVHLGGCGACAEEVQLLTEVVTARRGMH